VGLRRKAGSTHPTGFGLDYAKIEGNIFPSFWIVLPNGSVY
jgi:hypothetical protein